MSKKVMIRDVAVGAGSPVAVQSMSNVESHDEKGILRQISELEEAGCEIVRLAVPDKDALEVFERVRRQTEMPLVADIHFDYRLAVGAIKAGADKIRINPGNIGSRDRMKKVVEAAAERNIPIRVGVNSGSLEKDIVEKNGGVTAGGLAESAIRNVGIVEDMGYDNIVISMKASDVKMTFDAHRIAAGMTEHPFHIGITEAGTIRRGKVKSAAGIGALLLSRQMQDFRAPPACPHRQWPQTAEASPAADGTTAPDTRCPDAQHPRPHRAPWKGRPDRVVQGPDDGRRDRAVLLGAGRGREHRGGAARGLPGPRRGLPGGRPLRLDR